MSNKREALEAAKAFLLGGNFVYPTSLLTDIEAALAEPEQEPVMIYRGRHTIDCGEYGSHDMQMLKLIPAGTKLYTSPREWQELSEDEVIKLAVSKNLGRTLTPFGMQTGDVFVTDKSYRTYELIGFAAALSAALRAKNGG